MRLLYVFVCLCVACGDDSSSVDGGFDATSDVPVDSSSDGARADAPTPDAAAVDSSADTGDAGDAATDPEDCTTSVDEDGNGLAGCNDPACWDEASCIDEDLVLNATGGWTACGDPIELDADQTAAVCDAGSPFPTEREFQCGRVATTIRLETYCEPDDGPGRALRYVLSMDLTSESQMLGPMTTRHTSFSSELGYLGQLYTAAGAGAMSTDDPIPTHEGTGPDGHRAIAWVVAEAGTQVNVLLGASSQTSTFTILEDGTVNAVAGDPIFFLTAGFNTTL